MKKDREEAKKQGLSEVELQDEHYKEYYDDIAEQKRLMRRSIQRRITNMSLQSLLDLSDSRGLKSRAYQKKD